MWERTLQDLIRGLRANKKDESKFIAQAVDEIRNEVKSKDMELKAGAVLKLTYLDMLGYDMSWASFHVVEVMSCPRVHLKSVGYLAATQSFNENTDVLMLTTNLIKKDLASTPAESAITLNGFSHIVTPDLARDLSPELIAMLTHSRAHIRKRAILALYRVFMNYPEVKEQGMIRLRERLEDPDPGVVAAAVNVLCELARRAPEEYLVLAPQLFHLLTTSSNNWMLIKIIKLFGSLSPYEPRLVKKLQPPITELISTTSAISLLYECVHTCIIGGMLQGYSGGTLARTCVSKLAAFLEDSDQNLKYIALLALVKIVPSHPHLVAEYQSVILASVNDQDISIRMRALDLVSAMVNRENLQSIVQQLLSHLIPETSSSALPAAAQSLAQHSIPGPPDNTKSFSSPSQSPAYRLVLSRQILSICSQSMYDNITNFEWYLSVLVDLAHIANVDIGAQIRDQLMGVVGRVRAVRGYAVKLMSTILSDDSMLRKPYEEGSCSEILWAAAWICGEYCSELAEPKTLLPYLLQPEVSNLTPETIAVYITAAAKIFGYHATETAQRWEPEDLLEIQGLVEMIIERIREFTGSPHVEVQERAANTAQLFSFVHADLKTHRVKAENEVAFTTASASFDPIAEPRFPKSLYLIHPLFTLFELNPVAPNAQLSVPIPEGLNLDEWIVPPPKKAVAGADKDAPRPDKKVKKSKKGKQKGQNGTRVKQKQIDQENEVSVEEEDPEERERLRMERLERMRDDPYYIVDERPPSRVMDDVDSIPVVRLDDMPSLAESASSSALSSLLRHSSPGPFVVEKEGEMPEGAISTQQQSETGKTSVLTPSPRHAPSFPGYEVPEDSTRTSTPEPIKVTRAKKKGTNSSKKKRLPNLAYESPVQ